MHLLSGGEPGRHDVQTLEGAQLLRVCCLHTMNDSFSADLPCQYICKPEDVVSFLLAGRAV